MDYASIGDSRKIIVETAKRVSKQDKFQSKVFDEYMIIVKKRQLENIRNLLVGLKALDFYAYKRSCEPFYSEGRKDGKSGPQNLIGHMAVILGYPKRERLGKSIYGFIQERTGFTLEFIKELCDTNNKQMAIEKINGSFFSTE